MKRFALIAATTVELEPVRQALIDAGREPAAVLTTGVGQRAAAQATQRLLAGVGSELDLVLHVGFAGGLDPVHRVGDVLRVGKVANERGERLTIDAAQGRAVLLTLDRVVATPTEKAELFRQHLAAAVDMETFAVARVVLAAGLPLIALRAISDPASRAIPPASVRWITAEGRPRPGLAALHALTRPWSIPALVRLGRDAGIAGRRLGAAAVEAVA